MIEQKNEWLVVVWNDGISQFFIERLTATEEEIKRYLLSLIEDDKKLSQETVSEGFMAFHAFASFDTYHIEYEARPLNKIKDATEMIEEL